MDGSRLAALTLSDISGEDRLPRDAILPDRRTSVHDGSSKGSSLAASPLMTLRRRGDRSPSASPVASVQTWLQQQQQQQPGSSPNVAHRGPAGAMVAAGWERGSRPPVQPNGAQTAQPAASIAMSAAPASTSRESGNDSVTSPAARSTPRESIDLACPPIERY